MLRPFAVPLVVAAGCGNAVVAAGDSGDADAASDSPVDAANTVHVAYVNAYASTVPPPTTYGVGAAFIETTNPLCGVREVGPCENIECVGTVGYFHTPSAGTITVTGGVIPTMITPGTNGDYGTPAHPTPTFAAGETLTFVASGAEVPAFSVSATFPAAIDVLMPVGSTIPIDHTADFTITWSGGSSASVVVADFIQMESDRSIELACTFDAMSGTGTIPAAAFDRVALDFASVTISTAGTQRVAAGSWTVVAYAGPIVFDTRVMFH